MFPGQGSHYTGMGMDLIASGSHYFRTLIEAGSDRVGFDLLPYVQGEKTEGFNRSSVLQPIITAVSLSYFEMLKAEGISADAVLGHSLGEITALAGAGVFSAYDAVDAAAFRGTVMDECAALCGGGGMAVVLFSDEDSVLDAVQKYGLSDSLFAANFNAPNQTVLSGTDAALIEFEKRFSEESRCKVQKIDVAGPWHTPFIAPGREKYLEWSEKKVFSKAAIDFIMNGTAEISTESEDYRQRTADQLVKPVYWSRCMQKTAELFSGSVVLEVGPGKILSGLMRANRLQKSFAAVENVNSVETVYSAAQLIHG